MLEHSETRNIWTVNELTKYIKSQLESDPKLREVWVRGEISNFKHHSRGHMYFTLKDSDSRVLAVMFAGHNRFLRFVPKDGLKVILRAECSVYERDGQYQLYVKEMQPDGIGNLYLAYEQLKQKLQEEGLFAQKRKLPRFPRKIALITSPTGAAIRDMMITLKRRYPLVKILIIPVLVQGEFAPASISKGIELANKRSDIDLIIVGRGGGSIEELWAFNDERVARTIFQSNIPTISAVGHETDYTIADFVADIRAATPTAAAEIAVPHLRELQESVKNVRHRLNKVFTYMIQQKRTHINHLKKASVLRMPTNRLQQYNQHLDKLNDRFFRLVKLYPSNRRNQVLYLHKRLQLANIPAKIQENQQQVQSLAKQLRVRVAKIQVEKKITLGSLIQRLEALSPLAVLKRGYTFAFDPNQKVIGSVEQISPGDLIYVQFKDGVVESTVWGISEEESLWNMKK